MRPPSKNKPSAQYEPDRPQLHWDHDEEDPSHLHSYHYEHNRPWHCDHYEQDGRQRHSDHHEEDPPQQQQNIGMPEESPWPSLPPWVTFVCGGSQWSRKVKTANDPARSNLHPPSPRRGCSDTSEHYPV